MRPRMPICAARPLLSSMARFFAFTSGLYESQPKYLRGAAVVELDGALLRLHLGAVRVPAKVDEAVPEVSRELRLARDVSHDKELEEANEGTDLRAALGGHHGEGLEASGHGREGESKGQVAGEAHAGGSHDVAEDSEHGDAAMLELHVAKAVKPRLVRVLEEAERVEEAERGLSANLLEKSAIATWERAADARGRMAGAALKARADTTRLANMALARMGACDGKV
eukprot:CAMPEP_0185564386 /NCGR_PEP_ID=MMETSP1381-20130426/65078_1 /TAXON_ID=298111 /ORGANISM="Pavlova sp., Strain CCMP459" /LENGTH=225 /DNA_ID=CAMNT_0028178323 /DNA_START=583 /DNA_END=1258 /DNA_ORIENTATION=+